MEDSLNKIHEELRGRLYKPFIFYIPRKFWLELDYDKWNEKRFDEFFDTVVLMKIDGNTKVINENPSSIYMFSKPSELDKNVYKILDLQEGLNEKSFKFLLDKYITQISFYLRVSKWMYENVKNDVKNLTKETFLSFELQKQTFEKHWQYIQENFISNVKKEDSNIKSRLSIEDFEKFNKLIKEPSELSLNKLNTNKTKIKRKNLLITDEEAEKFLLISVFNIKL